MPTQPTRPPPPASASASPPSPPATPKPTPSPSPSPTITLRPARLTDHLAIARLNTRAFFNDILFGQTIHPHRYAYPHDSDHYWLTRNLLAWADWSHLFVVAVAVTRDAHARRPKESVVGQAHWSRIGLSASENARAGWGLNGWWDVRRALRPVVQGLVWVLGLVWRNRAADPAREGIVEGSYGFIDHVWDEEKQRCPSLYLESLAVDPEFQGKGVGRMLVRAGLDMAEREAISASVISADGKESFYQRCGYDVGPVGRSGEGEGNPLWPVPGGLVFFREAPGKRRSEKEEAQEVDEVLQWLKKDSEAGWPSVWLQQRAGE